MSGSDETRTITGWRQATRWYRRRPGLGWLLALLVIPLLLALLSGVLGKPKKDVDLTVPAVSPSVTVPTVAAPDLGVPTALAIMRSGNDLTLTGEVPDEAAKTSLVDSLKGVYGPDVNLIDKLTIKSGVNLPDLAGIGPSFKSAIDIPDFGWKFDVDKITLTGTAPSDDVKAAAGAAAKAAWPTVDIDNEIQVVAASPPVASATGCASLQADVSGLLRTPINFDTDGYSVASNSRQMLSQVADKIKACPDSKIAVKGYTDNSGNDAINQPLSENRAKSVADFLVSQGVVAGNVTSQGFGSANPVAGNDTPEGRAQNRRVDIAVS